MAAALALLSSPIGRFIGTVGLVLLLLGGVYVKGRGDGTDACQARVQREVDAEKARQRAAADAALADAAHQADVTAGQLSALNDQVNAYEAEIAARPVASACVLGPDDARRLSNIR